MAITLTPYVNGQEYSSSSIRITDGYPILTWSRVDIPLSIADGSGDVSATGVVDQLRYEVRVGSVDTDLGTAGFVGDLVSTGWQISKDKQFAYNGPRLQRGFEYYGQVRVTDELSDASGWESFKFTFNELPQALSPSISPSAPENSDDLILSYTYVDDDGDIESGTKIRWFKNGVHERIFDNLTEISSRDTGLGDVWFADVLPGDGFENGGRSTSSSVTVISTPTDLQDGTELTITPENPTDNDILKAHYRFDPALSEDLSIIRWYVNDNLQSAFNDNKYARPDVSLGDIVRVELTEYDGFNEGQSYVSENYAIIASDFSVYEIRLDGRESPYSVLARRPLVTWKNHVPTGSSVANASIRLGTYWGGDNVYSTSVSVNNVESFRIPEGVLERGKDYFLSVAISDSNSFDKYTTTRFRMSGSLWRENVDNATGWTIETGFIFTSAGSFNIDEYHAIRIQDGEKFAEVRIYGDRIGIYSSTLTLTQTSNVIHDFSKDINTLNVSGSGSDIQIYLNNALEIDGTGLLTQSTTSKALSFGKPLGGTDLEIRYDSFNYTVSGSYDPSSSSEYQNLTFYKKIQFDNQELVGISTRYTVELGEEVDENSIKEIYYLVAANNYNESEGGSIYAITKDTPKRYATTRRTFVPINRIRGSEDDDYTVFAHSRGASVFNHYPIFFYDYSIDLSSALPTQNGWELYQNIGQQAATFSGGGLNIDTTYSNTGGKWTEEDADYFPGDLDSECSDCPEFSVGNFLWEDLDGGDYDYDDQEIDICMFNPCSDLTFTSLGVDSNAIDYYRIENLSGINVLLSFFSAYGTASLSHRYIFYQTDTDGSNQQVLFDTGTGVQSVGFCNANILLENGKRLRVYQQVGGGGNQTGYHDELDTNGRVRCVLTPCTP